MMGGKRVHDVLNFETATVLNVFPEQVRFAALSFIGETGQVFRPQDRGIYK